MVFKNLKKYANSIILFDFVGKYIVCFVSYLENVKFKIIRLKIEKKNQLKERGREKGKKERKKKKQKNLTT